MIANINKFGLINITKNNTRIVSGRAHFDKMKLFHHETNKMMLTLLKDNTKQMIDIVKNEDNETQKDMINNIKMIDDNVDKYSKNFDFNDNNNNNNNKIITCTTTINDNIIKEELSNNTSMLLKIICDKYTHILNDKKKHNKTCDKVIQNRELFVTINDINDGFRKYWSYNISCKKYEYNHTFLHSNTALAITTFSALFTMNHVSFPIYIVLLLCDNIKNKCIQSIYGKMISFTEFCIKDDVKKLHNLNKFSIIK